MQPFYRVVATNFVLILIAVADYSSEVTGKR